MTRRIAADDGFVFYEKRSRFLFHQLPTLVFGFVMTLAGLAGLVATIQGHEGAFEIVRASITLLLGVLGVFYGVTHRWVFAVTSQGLTFTDGRTRHLWWDQVERIQTTPGDSESSGSLIVHLRDGAQMTATAAGPGEEASRWERGRGLPRELRKIGRPGLVAHEVHQRHLLGEFAGEQRSIWWQRQQEGVLR